MSAMQVPWLFNAGHMMSERDVFVQKALRARDLRSFGDCSLVR